MAAAAAGGAVSSDRLLFQFPHSSTFLCSSSNLVLELLRREKKRIRVKTRENSKRAMKCLPAVKASLALDASGLITSEELQIVNREVGEEGALALPVILTDMAKTSLKILKANIQNKQNWASQIQLFIEKGLLNCRFFTLVAVAGSLIGSLICFFEGCFLILDSFFAYFRTTSHLDDGVTMRLLVEAIHMYLMGTGMLNFGFGMYIMFVGAKRVNRYNNNIQAINARSGIAVPFQQMILPSSTERHWLSQAKSKLGQAVMMILQAGTVEKFKSVPMATGLDMVCFAGAVFLSSASIFLLSRLLYRPVKVEEEEEKEEEEEEAN